MGKQNQPRFRANPMAVDIDGRKMTPKKAFEVADSVKGGRERLKAIFDQRVEEIRVSVEESIKKLTDAKRMVGKGGVFEIMQPFVDMGLVNKEGRNPYVSNPNRRINVSAQRLAYAANERINVIAKQVANSRSKKSDKPKRQPEKVQTDPKITARIENAINALPNVKKLVPKDGEDGLYPLLEGFVKDRILDKNSRNQINVYYANPKIPEAAKLAQLVNLRVKVIAQADNAPKKYERVSKAENGFTTVKVPGYEGVEFAFQIRTGDPKDIKNVGKGALRNTPKKNSLRMLYINNLVPNIPMDPDELMAIKSKYGGVHYSLDVLDTPDFVMEAVNELQSRQSGNQSQEQPAKNDDKEGKKPAKEVAA